LATTGLLELRRLHLRFDLAIRDAYGWQNLPLEPDSHEVETLAENDRVRYTISPAALAPKSPKTKRPRKIRPTPKAWRDSSRRNELKL